MTNADNKLYQLLPQIYRVRDAERGYPLKKLLQVLEHEITLLKGNINQLYLDQFIETCAEWVVPYIGDLIAYQPLHPIPGISAKSEVANTIAYRRRKGTSQVIQQIAADVTDWRAHVVEFFQFLSKTQHIDNIRPDKTFSPNLRDRLQLNTPFDTCAHTVDVKNLQTDRGKYNIPHVGVYLWKAKPYPLKLVTPKQNGNSYHFHPCGLEMPLFHIDRTKTLSTPYAKPIDNKLDKELYYHEDGFLLLRSNGDGYERVPVEQIHFKDPQTSDEYFLIDPANGTFTCPNLSSPSQFKVSCWYGFGAEIGGGAYARADQPTAPAASNFTSPSLGGSGETIIASNETTPLDSGENISGTRAIKAAAQYRPFLELTQALTATGEEPSSQLILEGLTLFGNSLTIEGTFNKVILRHCTLYFPLSSSQSARVLTLNALGPGVESILGPQVEIDSCVILGSILASKTISLKIRNSIISASHEGSDQEFAYKSTTNDSIEIETSTLFGKVEAHTLKQLSNSIITSSIKLTGGIACDIQKLKRDNYFSIIEASPKNISPVKPPPFFASRRYPHPDYGQLSNHCDTAITHGASDESELGAFHDLYTPKRIANLKRRLEEYLPINLKAAIFNQYYPDSPAP